MLSIKTKIKMLGIKLEQELPQILGWAIEGAKLYFESGLQEPNIVKSEVEEYRMDMDVVSRWVKDNCEVSNDYSQLASQLYVDYKRWAEVNKEHVLSNTLFGRNMVKKYDRKRMGSGNYYFGLKLKEKTLFEKLDLIQVGDNI